MIAESIRCGSLIMNSIWRLVFRNLSGGQKSRHVLLKSLALAFPAALLAIPYFYFLLFDFPRKGGATTGLGNAQALLWGQSAMFFIICMLSAIGGTMFTKRLNLPGIGDISRWRNELPYLIGGGLTMMVITYLAFDRYFYSVSPESYPDLSVYMIFLPIKGAFTDELILRFGLVTIGVGICRNRYGGAVLVAAFATILSFKYLEFAGVPLEWNYVCIMQLILSFAVNLILGIVFVTRGLLSTMTVKLMVEMRYGLAALFL